MHGSYLCIWITENKGPHTIKWSPSPKLTPGSLSYELQRTPLWDVREDTNLMGLVSVMSPRRAVPELESALGAVLCSPVVSKEVTRREWPLWLLHARVLKALGRAGQRCHWL